MAGWSIHCQRFLEEFIITRFVEQFKNVPRIDFSYIPSWDTWLLTIKLNGVHLNLDFGSKWDVDKHIYNLAMNAVEETFIGFKNYLNPLWC